MTTPPDKLFREGLEQYRKPAPASAWERIESGLDRKRKRSPWMKIAAGLLLVITSSVMFFLRETSDARRETVDARRETGDARHETADARRETADAIRGTADVRRETVDVRRETADVRRETEDVRRETADVRRETEDVRRETADVRREIDPKSYSLQSTVYSLQSSASSEQSAVGSRQSSASNQTSEQVATNMEHTVVQAEITNETSPTDDASDSKGTSITYSAEEVNAKYLRKDLTPEATPEKKNTSGFQKVIDLAMDIKNEGNVLGEIRDKKNELLSFNMPSSKREINK